MKLIIWKSRFVIPLLLLSLIFVILWFQNGLIHGGGDEELLFVNTKKAVDVSSSVWLHKGTGEAVLYWLSRVSFVYIIYIFNHFFSVPNVFLQATTYFILLATGAASTYFLTRILINSGTFKIQIGFVAGLFYILNPYSMSQVWGRGEYAQLFSFALLPLSLLIFIYGIRKNSYFYVFIFALISVFFSTSYGFVTFIVIQWFMFFVYAILEIILNRKRLKTVFIFKYFLLSFLLWCIVNCWWLLPLVLSGPSIFGADLNNPGENLGTLLGVSSDFPFPIIIRLLQNFYFFSEHSYGPQYAILRFQLMSFIPVIFLLLGMVGSVIKRKNTGVIFFLSTFILGLIVCLGANPPLGGLFVWIFKHISFLQAFRNPYEKFGIVYMLGYSQLVGLGVVILFQFLTNIRKKNNLFFPIIIIFCLILVMWNTYLWPMWTGKIVSNPQNKIGLTLPQYYIDLASWLQKNNGNYRVLMTPLWNGDGAFYLWNGTLYQGVDPMVFLLEPDTISNIGNIPYYVTYAHNVLKYRGQLDLHPAIELLRVKYLIDREDTTQTTKDDREQYLSFTKTIYPMSDSDIDSICSNQHVSVPQDTQASIICNISTDQSNWGKIHYARLTLSTDVPSYVEIIILDSDGTQEEWDGRGDKDYLVGPQDKTVTFALNSPNIPNDKINFLHIQRVQVYAHPINDFGGSARKISLKQIGLNTGTKTTIDEFRKIHSIGKLSIYSPNNLITPPEFGTLSSIKAVSDYKDLFQQAYNYRNDIDKIGFVIKQQNTNSLLSLNSTFVNSGSVSNISDTRYFIQLKSTSPSYLLLSKTFYPGWKVLGNVNKNMLDGSFIHNIELLFVTPVSEKQHFVANGYANLWIVNGKDAQYAAIFLPQIYADIGRDISTGAIILSGSILLYTLFLKLKK